MTNVTELQKAILGLSDAEYTQLIRWQLIRWLRDQDWELWEREFEEDVRAGKLDALAAEALRLRPRANSRTFRCTGRVHASGGTSRSCPRRCNKRPAGTSIS